MKATESFKQIISNHLQGLAAKDPLFAETLKKESKNIDDCITYILNEVKKSGMAGFADDEIFNMAIHYYDEDNLEVGKKINAKVIVNHHVELSPEEIEKAKQDARDKVMAEQELKLKNKPAKKVPEKSEVQHSLF